MPKDIYLYANHPVIRVDGQYYAATANFVDFLSELSNRSDCYRLLLPCEQGSKEDVRNYVRLDVRTEVLELSSYRGHLSAIFTTFINAVKLRGMIMNRSAGKAFYLAGPGPNSMMFWLSFFLPACSRFFFFIRGDTVETIRHIYKTRSWGRLPVFISSVFQWRIFRLLKSGKAVVFTYGDKLKEKYSQHGSGVYSIAPLITSDIVDYVRRNQPRNDDALHVLFVGRLSGEKGVVELVKAVAGLIENGAALRLTVIGDGYLKASISEFVLQYGYSEQINIVGHVPAGPGLWDYFDSSDLLCLPSRTEGTPRVIVEAFARHLPVLATPVGSIPFMFPGNVVMLEHGEIDDISGALQWCADNRETLVAKGLAGSESVYKYLLPYNADMVDSIIRYVQGEKG